MIELLIHVHEVRRPDFDIKSARDRISPEAYAFLDVLLVAMNHIRWAARS
jgi:hypothetical protein